MSNLPFPWWDKTVTIYNKVVDPTTQRVSWYRTYVTNCFWKYVNNTYTLKSNPLILETKSVICRIPKDKRFVDKATWKSLTDRNDKFTFANGDIIILGRVDDVIDEYTSGSRSTDLLAKYKELDACIEIDTYVDNTQTGVDLEHYRIVGK